MKVYEYLSSVPDDQIAEAMKREYSYLSKEKIERILEKKREILQSIQIKEDLVGIRVEHNQDVTGKEFWDVYGVTSNCEDLAIEFAPWGVITPLEVTPDPGLSDSEIAAHLIREMTLLGDDERKKERRFEIEEASLEPMKEFKPGIMVSESALREIEANPDLKALLEGMSVEDFKNAGRRIKPD
jgi:hypothetical protein